jgi:hypothetical protein
MFGRFFNGVKAVASKVWDVVKTPLRKVGEIGIKYHQPISMVASGLLGASGNPTLQKLGAGVALGSAYLTSKGVGNNYLSGSQPQMSGG